MSLLWTSPYCLRLINLGLSSSLEFDTHLLDLQGYLYLFIFQNLANLWPSDFHVLWCTLITAHVPAVPISPWVEGRCILHFYYLNHYCMSVSPQYIHRKLKSDFHTVPSYLPTDGSGTSHVDVATIGPILHQWANHLWSPSLCLASHPVKFLVSFPFWSFPHFIL